MSATDFALKKLYSLFGRENVGQARVYKKSVDARRRDNITAVYSVAAEVCAAPSDELMAKEGISLLADADIVIPKGEKPMSNRPVVVGNGPCGMLCALLLAENGYRPIVIERGDSVDDRVKAVDDFYKTKQLDTESNVQYGAGGAGTFSDGKLVTRINDPRCRYVLKRFAEFGAPESVLTLAKPHIGTDKLVSVVSNINKRIEQAGGTVMYRTALNGFIRSSDGSITGVKTSRGDIQCELVVLATGNSARDVYKYLLGSDIDMQEKALSVGLRIEHLRKDVEYALFGSHMMSMAKRSADIRELLGHAEYAYSMRTDERAVYTFCMCPGGQVVCG